MDEHDLLADRFETHRPHLRAVAYRMLGSAAEAEDAVQEAWLRLSRTDTTGVANLAGWLTTVVARVSLNMLQSRRTRREDPVGQELPDSEDVADPEHEVVLADSVGLALLVVLDTLAPAERLAFVLHDMFAVPFDEIAPIVDRTPAAARQLASRARRRVQGTETVSGQVAADQNRQREIVSAFLAASREGDFDALLAALDPDIVLRADRVAVQMGADAEVRGAAEVARTFSGRARGAKLALIDGLPGLVWSMGGEPKVVFAFLLADGKVAGIDLLSDPETLAALELELF
jgi:RNA polymerase sigma-70 factor (ECF subfamily)